MPECPDCEREFYGPRCQCGFTLPTPRETKPQHCLLDGAALEADGLCHVGGGYPGYLPCPHVCPHCRQRLGWDGGCSHCHGCVTANRADWTFPGDRYELAESGHWVQYPGLAQGRRACRDQENLAGVRAIFRILGVRLPITGAKLPAP